MSPRNRDINVIILFLAHSVFLQKVTEDTKREMNVSIYYQLLRETLEILKSTNVDYERNLGRSHSSKSIKMHPYDEMHVKYL